MHIRNAYTIRRYKLQIEEALSLHTNRFFKATKRWSFVMKVYQSLTKILSRSTLTSWVFAGISGFIYCFVCLPTLLKIKLATNATTTSAISHSNKEKIRINARTVNSSSNAIATAPTVRLVLRAEANPEPLDASILKYAPHFTKPSYPIIITVVGEECKKMKQFCSRKC